MNENFTVYRDGQEDASYKRRKQLKEFRRAAWHGFVESMKPLGQATRQMLDEWELYEYDQRHHTHLLREYRAKREQAKLESMRRSYGLV